MSSILARLLLWFCAMTLFIQEGQGFLESNADSEKPVLRILKSEIGDNEYNVKILMKGKEVYGNMMRQARDIYMDATMESSSYGNGESVLTFIPSDGKGKQIRGLFRTREDHLLEIDAEDSTGSNEWVVKEFSLQSRVAVENEFLRQHNRELQTAGYIPFFPGCFLNDKSSFELVIGIALDYGLVKSFNNNLATARAQIEFLVASARPLFVSQLNINPVIGRMEFGASSGTGPEAINPLSMDNAVDFSCIGNDEYLLSSFASWNNQYNYRVSGREMAYWHLFTACTLPGTEAGRAYVGTVCATNRNVGFSIIKGGWKTFAHEFIHGLGAEHSVGGIMDSMNPYYNGIIQISPDNRVDICEVLSSANMDRCKTNSLFRVVTQEEQCGDLILTDKEECECLQAGSKKCGKCVNCQLQSSSSKKKVQCTVKDFIVRPPDAEPGIIPVTTSLLSSDICCTSDGEFELPSKLCNDRDVCIQGKCTRMCALYALTPCPMTGNGCTQPCMMNKVCTSTLTTATTNRNIHHVPDGTVCGNDKTCQTGECVSSQPTVPLPPTSKSPTTKSPTTAKTNSPTPQPVSAKNTKYPTPLPTTRRPSRRPTRLPTTESPVITASPTAYICPPAKAFAKCETLETNVLCNANASCMWCNTARGKPVVGRCKVKLVTSNNDVLPDSCDYSQSDVKALCSSNEN